jgi:hypothetical protein
MSYPPKGIGFNKETEMSKKIHTIQSSDKKEFDSFLK